MFHNEDDTPDRSATNPVFEHDEPTNYYEEVDTVLMKTKVHGMPAQ